ncbi:MAG TPA: hypothetical protein DDY31_02405 [Lachnospiraceae bacterium]|nr:hypothetical protein [Lachnospiraceae bacterium]
MREYMFRKSLQKSDLSEKDKLKLCNQMLLEYAVWFFMNSHQTDEMIGHCESFRRQADMVHRQFDFESKELCIEMKVFMPKSDARCGSLERRFGKSIERMMAYVTGSSDSEMKGKRIILFVVGRQGFSKEIPQLIDQKSIGLLRLAVNMGLELWSAEMELKQGNSIELLSCKNMTNDILKLM